MLFIRESFFSTKNLSVLCGHLATLPARVLRGSIYLFGLCAAAVIIGGTFFVRSYVVVFLVSLIYVIISLIYQPTLS